ncbi:MAG: class I SAM-dependent methyltransferase [Desulfobacterales bacterium]|nr:class I SAM-dependent methyltransferase [Desulfobacterales bacterium]
MNNIFQSVLCCPKCREKLTNEGQRVFCSLCLEDVAVDDRFIDFDRLNPKLNLDLDAIVQKITEYAGITMNDIDIDWRIAAILKDIRKNARGTVCLEIGGADGPMTPVLENLFDTTLTLDYSKHFLKRIQNKTERAICVYSNAHFLPIQDNVLDMIICCEVLEHSTIPTQLLTEMRRSVKKDGMIILSVPNEQIIYHRKKHSNYKFSQAGDTHINFFTPDSLGNLLFRTGLEIIHMKTIFPPNRSIKNLYSNMKNYIKRSFSGNFIVCLARPMANPLKYWDILNSNLKNNAKKKPTEA